MKFCINTTNRMKIHWIQHWENKCQHTYNKTALCYMNHISFLSIILFSFPIL